MILYNYLAFKYFKLFSLTTIVITILILLIDFIELLRRFAKKNIDISKIFEVSLLKQIPILVEILPFVILISAIFFFTRLSSNSEITIIKSSSLNSKKIFAYPLLIILLIALSDITILRIISKETKEKYEHILQNDFGVYNSTQTKHLWFKEESNPPYFFGAKKIEFLDQINFKDLIIINHKDQQNKIIKADKATLDNKLIKMSGVKLINSNNNIENIQQLNMQMEIDPNIIKARFNNEAIKIESHYSAYELLKKIKQNDIYGNGKIKYKILLNNMFAKILYYIFLFLLAAYFCVFPPRYSKKLINIIVTVTLAFITFFILNILFTLTYAGKINLYYGIWLPNIILLLIIINLNLQAELGKKIWS